MIPEPDYNDKHRQSQFRNNHNNNYDNNNENVNVHHVAMDKDGLIIPRKPAIPCFESTEYRELNRELKFHQKT